MMIFDLEVFPFQFKIFDEVIMRLYTTVNILFHFVIESKYFVLEILG